MTDIDRKLLAVITASQERTNRIQSELRNVGLSATAQQYTAVGEFLNALPEQAFDLILIDEAVSSDAPQEVLHAVEQHSADLPVLIMGESSSLLKSMGAMDLGAQDFVSYKDWRHMCLICLREIEVYDDRRRMQALYERARALEDRAKALLRDTGDPFAFVQEGILTELNPAFGVTLGYDGEDDLVGTPLLDHAASADQPILKELLKRAGKDDKARVDAEVRFVKGDGSQTAPLRIQLTATTHEGEPAIRCSITRNINDNGAALGNRSGLFDTLGRTEFNEDGFTSGLLFIALDEFDSLEQRLGFLDSEEVLTGVSGIIAPLLAPGDRVFQFSSAELAVVVRRNSADAIRELGESVQKQVADRTITTTHHETTVTVTIVSYPMVEGDDTQKTLQTVRDETRQASAKGGNKALFVGPTAEASERKNAAERQAKKIKDALKKDMLRLAYQPIASLEGMTGEIYDTHVRMFDDSGNEYTATEFLPIAAQYDLLPAIDCWVVRSALKNLAEGAQNNVKTSVFVRVSTDTLSKPGAFVKAMEKALNEFDIGDGKLVLEITEFVLRDNRDKASSLLQATRDVGVSLAIDRFGGNSNSLQLLDTFDPVYVKLDPSFTSTLTGGGNAEAHSRFREIIEVAHQRKVKTIAEHVEDAVAMAKLWQLGINYVQGNHVQEPEVVLAEAAM